MPDGDDSFDVLCYGTISVDHITRLDRLPGPRRDAIATAEYSELGGEALQVAVVLATWGLRVLVVGNVIGADWQGRFIVEHLAQHPNIDTRYLRCDPTGVTPFSRVLVTPDGEPSRIAYWYDRTPHVELTEAMMRQARLLSVDAYGRAERARAAEVARALGKPVISADAIHTDSPLATSSDAIVISGARLLQSYPEKFQYDHVLELQDQGAGVVLITDGPRPVLVVRADGSAFGVEPYEMARIVDTSAAGNLFRAGIVYGWRCPEWPLEQKVKFACAAAGLYCCRERGDDPPSLEAISHLMHSQPR